MSDPHGPLHPAIVWLFKKHLLFFRKDNLLPQFQEILLLSEVVVAVGGCTPRPRRAARLLSPARCGVPEAPAQKERTHRARSLLTLRWQHHPLDSGTGTWNVAGEENGQYCMSLQ